jgi:hypothetical protein
MIRIKNVGGYDWASVALLATALLSLLTAAAIMARSHPSAIPERLLDRVRGANPSYYRSIDQYTNCTTWNIYYGGLTGYVPYYGCTALNTPCVTCASKANYDLNYGTGTPLAFPKPIGIVDCNNPAGWEGTCGFMGTNLACFFSQGYDCDQYASNFNLE